MQLIGALVLFSALAAANPFGPPAGFKAPVKTTTKSTTTTTKTASSVAAAVTTSSTTTTTTTTTVAAAAAVTCLTSNSASFLVNGYASLLTAYNNATANAILATTFTDTSDSINYLAGKALGATTFASLTAFELGQGAQPAIGFSIIAIDAVGCTNVGFRWTASLGQYPVKGINIFSVTNLNGTDAGWQINSMYAEFNVGAWELNIGQSCGAYSPGDTIG